MQTGLGKSSYPEYCVLLGLKVLLQQLRGIGTGSNRENVKIMIKFWKIRSPVARRGKLSTLALAKCHESDFDFVKLYLKPEVFGI